MIYEILLRQNGMQYAKCTVIVSCKRDARDIALGWIWRLADTDCVEVRNTLGELVYIHNKTDREGK